MQLQDEALITLLRDTMRNSSLIQMVVKRLLRAPDPIKDQSYFLCALTQEQLDRVLFPIGKFQKTEVRALAQEFDLPNKHRPDSQGLCFLGKVKFDEFLAAYLGERPGNIIDARTGEVLGRHHGVWYHTVGQRKGIGKVLNPKQPRADLGMLWQRIQSTISSMPPMNMTKKSLPKPAPTFMWRIFNGLSVHRPASLLVRTAEAFWKDVST